MKFLTELLAELKKPSSLNVNCTLSSIQYKKIKLGNGLSFRYSIGLRPINLGLLNGLDYKLYIIFDIPFEAPQRIDNDEDNSFLLSKSPQQ